MCDRAFVKYSLKAGLDSLTVDVANGSLDMLDDLEAENERLTKRLEACEAARPCRIKAKP